MYSAPIISPEQFWWRRADSLSFPQDVISFFHTSRSLVITCRFNKNIPLPAYTTSNKMETSHSSSWSLYFITSNLLPPFPFTRTVAKETPWWESQNFYYILQFNPTALMWWSNLLNANLLTIQCMHLRDCEHFWFSYTPFIFIWIIPIRIRGWSGVGNKDNACKD